MLLRFRLVGGVVVPTALFVAMIVLLLSTSLIATVSYNFGMSRRSVEETEFRYLSFAAVNEMISDLNNLEDQLDPEAFTKNQPRRVLLHGRVTESWVEPIDGSTDRVFVVAKTFRPGQGNPIVVKRLANFKLNTLARAYTNVTDTNKDSPDPIYFSDASNSGAWDRLPDLPRQRYSPSGTIELKQGELAGSIPYVAGSPDGSLYALYAPTLDGWDDQASTAIFLGFIPMTLPWGDFALNTMVNGTQQGLTVGDMVPVAQVLVGHVKDVTVSKGALMLKYSHDSGQWTALPPVEEATLVNGKFEVDSGNYHVQGVAGPLAAYDGGLTAPIYRRGQDSIYQYSDESGDWKVLTPPGTDVMHLAADSVGKTYVQTGDLQPVGIKYLLDILLKNLLDIYPNTSTSALYKQDDEGWAPISNPPARFFDKSGNLVQSSYKGSRGPFLGGMVGGEEGELYVVNRPSSAHLVDTIYKYSNERVWEVVPSPPNKYFDESGLEVELSELPTRLEVGSGSEGELLLRVPNDKGSDGIFVKTKTGYEMFSSVKSASGAYEKVLSQMSGGRPLDGSGKGTFHVKATYF